MSTPQKVLIGATSPIWFPLATVAAILALPVLEAVAVKDSVSGDRNVEDYNRCKDPFVSKWIDEEIASSQHRMYTISYQSYLTSFEKAICNLYKVSLPKQIAAYRIQAKTIAGEIRDLQTELRKFKEMQKEFAEIFENLLLCMVHWSKWVWQSTVSHFSEFHKGNLKLYCIIYVLISLDCTRSCLFSLCNFVKGFARDRSKHNIWKRYVIINFVYKCGPSWGSVLI